MWQLSGQRCPGWYRRRVPRAPRPACLEPLQRYGDRDDQNGIQHEVLGGGQLVQLVLAHYDAAAAPSDAGPVIIRKNAQGHRARTPPAGVMASGDAIDVGQHTMITPVTLHSARGGTFDKSGPSPSTIVGCARTASRSLEYGISASIAACTVATTSPASAPIIVKPRMRS